MSNLELAVEAIKKFSLYSCNVSYEEFIKAMYPESSEQLEYVEEKWNLFRTEPCYYFLTLDIDKRIILVNEVLKKYK
jgi:hypothetical protein